MIPILVSVVVIAALSAGVLGYSLRPRVVLLDVDNVDDPATWKMYRRWWLEEKEVSARLRAELDLLKGKGPYR